ncbi:MAG: hypothetical protein MRZ73_06870 [Pseudoflavonifractor capillosus]|uniref:hypothetical protein n=1 Tax=Pseudoflavonifractor capillosus TaxID=106588 RepID=UPI0023F7FEE0|nr:hypothetical protein [Pseudoflavonifractor capillosus]MCI5928249.1 hypothetical protein [Pseudoflavonifractor capillosus]
MNFLGDDLREALGVLLTIWWPLLVGLAALALLAVATNKKPPKGVRILCGTVGAIILLASLVIVFRALLT